MEEALIAILLSDPGLIETVGNRIDWGRRSGRKPVLPAIVLTRISGTRDLDLHGASGLVDSIVQADCYGETYASAKGAARALRDAVNGRSFTERGVVIQRISIDSERDTNERDGQARDLFRTSLDLTIWHDE